MLRSGVPGGRLIHKPLIRRPLSATTVSAHPSSPAMSDYNNTFSTANGRESERKDRATPDSDSGNVVDHHAPHGESSFSKEQGEGVFREAAS